MLSCLDCMGSLDRLLCFAGVSYYDTFNMQKHRSIGIIALLCHFWVILIVWCVVGIEVILGGLNCRGCPGCLGCPRCFGCLGCLGCLFLFGCLGFQSCLCCLGGLGSIGWCVCVCVCGHIGCHTLIHSYCRSAMIACTSSRIT